VIFIDTLHHFPETLSFVEHLSVAWALDVHVARTPEVTTRVGFAALHGDRLWERDVARFHHLTKVAPLLAALDQLDATAWLSGRRRDQAVTRAQLQVAERDSRGLLKVNPLATWTRDKVWAYIRHHQLPYNPLYEQGFASIGDEPLTTPILPGEDERAGRWRGHDRHECGIHL
jgi:phosphoadenosine phosphosulfate reductase